MQNFKFSFSGIYPLHDVHIRKVKVMKRPRFDLNKLMDMHGEGSGKLCYKNLESLCRLCRIFFYGQISMKENQPIFRGVRDWCSYSQARLLWPPTLPPARPWSVLRDTSPPCWSLSRFRLDVANKACWKAQSNVSGLHSAPSMVVRWLFSGVIVQDIREATTGVKLIHLLIWLDTVVK